MSSPADASVFGISGEALRQPTEYSQPERIQSILIPEIEDITDLSVDDVNVDSLKWQSALHSMERNFRVKDGWQVYEKDTEGVVEWVPATPITSSPVEFLQYFTRRSRVKRDFRNLRGRYEEPDTISLNYELLENLAESGDHPVEDYIDATALEELGHLVLNQNLDIERSGGYAGWVRRREEKLVDELADDIFQDLNGYSIEELSGMEVPYHEEVLARLDRAVSWFGKEMPPQLDPREAYRTDEEVPEPVYSGALNTDNVENWLNTGKVYP